ncbi:MAG TPA: cytochrome c [Gaiellaceae bacterium]|nr:cytochrome c [Gaiellaceae bacterium]
MRRASFVVVLLVGAIGLAAAGCGGGETKTAAPETTEGTLPTPTETTTTTDTGDGDAVEGDPAAGKEVFAEASCAACHALADSNASGAVGPNLDQTMPSYDLVVDRVTNGLGGMPSYKDSLSEQQIADVAAYISSVAG